MAIGMGAASDRPIAGPGPKPERQTRSARSRVVRCFVYRYSFGSRMSSTRCPTVTERCRIQRPPLRPVAGRMVACHYAEVQVVV